MAYILDPTDSQDSFLAKLETEYPHVPFIEGGMLDTDDGILKFPDGSIKPFGVIHFGNPRRSARNRGFVDSKLDQYSVGADIAIVARSANETRVLLNDIGNTLIDWKPVNSGRVVEGAALWRDTRSILDARSRPTRFATTRRFEWTFQASKVL